MTSKQQRYRPKHGEKTDYEQYLILEDRDERVPASDSLDTLYWGDDEGYEEAAYDSYDGYGNENEPEASRYSRSAEISYTTDAEWEATPARQKQRTKYHVRLNRFLNNALILVSVLLIVVIVVALLF